MLFKRLGRPRNSSLPFVATDPHIEENPKVRKLLKQLSILAPVVPKSLLIEYLQKIFKYCGRRAIDGNLGKISAEDLADICQWDFAPQPFFDAFVSLGFLDIDPDGNVLVHDWADYSGMVYEKRVKERKRIEAHRKARSEAKQARSEGLVAQHTRVVVVKDKDISLSSSSAVDPVPETQCVEPVETCPLLEFAAAHDIKFSDAAVAAALVLGDVPQPLLEESLKDFNERATSRNLAYFVSIVAGKKNRATRKPAQRVETRKQSYAAVQIPRLITETPIAPKWTAADYDQQEPAMKAAMAQILGRCAA
jgi:hypothetical protein